VSDRRTVSPQGRPPINPGEERERFLVGLGATDHDALVTAAGELGYIYNGEPSKGKLASAVLLQFLGLNRAMQRELLCEADSDVQ